MKIPGKKPAKKTPMGNLLHLGATLDALELTPVEIVGVDVAVEEAVEVLVLLAPLLLADELEELLSVVPDLLVSVMMLQIGGPDWDAIQA